MERRSGIDRHGFAVPLLLGVAIVLPSCGACDNARHGKDPEISPPVVSAQRPTLDLFALGRTLGTVAPCGCTTEPLGGLPYLLGTLAAASAGPRVVVEPGSLLFPDPAGPEAPTNPAAWVQATRRAQILQEAFAKLAPGFVAGVGPTDVLTPGDQAKATPLSLPRVLANGRLPSTTAATDTPGVAPHRLITHSSAGLTMRIGVSAVVDPDLAGATDLAPLESPTVAAKRQVAAMRSEGADVTVMLAHGNRDFAESLVRAVPELDLVVVAVVDGIDRQRLGSATTQVGDTFVLEPGQQLQTVTHMHVSVAPGLKELPPVENWTVVPSRSAQEAELARVTARVERFAKDPNADPQFLQRLRGEKERLTRVLANPEPSQAQVTVTFDQLKITCHNPVDPHGRALLSEYDTWVAQTNKKAFADVKPPPPPAGEPSYVGIEQCEMCHDEAAEFWQTTRHAQAYETLVRDNKQFDLSCVGCHLTGFDEPGGSHVVQNEGLQAVQCEVCHGPGSLHVDEPERGGQPYAIQRLVPETVCSQCHTPDHSDTFELEPYLRDILGAGHGDAARKALGNGPTGRELRAAGFAAAGGACKKM